MTARIGFIGGSGLYEMDGLEGAQPVDVDTPFGPPSDSIVVGEMSGESVAFLPRHGRGHRISPSNLPARANIYALKLLGVERVVSISAVGSLQDRIADRVWHGRVVAVYARNPESETGRPPRPASSSSSAVIDSPRSRTR